MPYASALSLQSDITRAIDEVCAGLAAGLDGHAPDVSFLFVSHAHAASFDDLPGLVRQRSASRRLLGCTGESVSGGGEEIEAGPVVSLWSAILPEADIELFHAQFSQVPDGIECHGLPNASNAATSDVRTVFALGEPYSSIPAAVIDHAAAEFPGVPLIGGMASGGAGPGTNRLFLDDAALANGMVGAVIRGGPRIRSVVSQGCRPIGKPYVVTRADGHIVLELGGMPPVERLREFVPTLPDRDRALLAGGLHLGIAMTEYRETFERGDFLVANVMGIRDGDGSLAIAGRVRTGQTVQFHVRDAGTAHDDLVELLQTDSAAHVNPARAALLFSCNGRGTRLFPAPHHDARTIQEMVGPIPLAGFFAQGELGPVGGMNYMHGFTASIALFE